MLYWALLNSGEDDLNSKTNLKLDRKILLQTDKKITKYIKLPEREVCTHTHACTDTHARKHAHTHTIMQLLVTL